MFSAASVCLSLYQYVCPHDNFRTTKRRTIKLGVLGTLYKNLAGVRRSKVKLTGAKKNKTESSPLTLHSRACAIARPYAACSNRRYHCVLPGVMGYAGGKISACCLV